MTRHLPEQARREQILSAARRCFIESGFHPTRMDDIARAAGLSKGGVYFHFKSKQEVFDSLVQEEFENSMAFLASVTREERPISEKMQSIAQHYMQYFSQAPEAPRFFIVMGEMALRDEALAGRLLEMQKAFVEQIAQLLQEGIEAGMIRPVNARTLGAVLKALLDGVEGLNALRYPMDPQEFLATGLDMVLNGLLKRE